jgi:hypothetical protein
MGNSRECTDTGPEVSQRQEYGETFQVIKRVKLVNQPVALIQLGCIATHSFAGAGIGGFRCGSTHPTHLSGPLQFKFRCGVGRKVVKNAPRSLGLWRCCAAFPEFTRFEPGSML